MDLTICSLIQRILGIAIENIFHSNLFFSLSLRLSSVKQVAARYITNDLLLIPQNVKYKTQLNIYIHQLDKYSSNLNKNALIKGRSPLSGNDSTSTEISGHDSETIHRFTLKNQGKLIIIILRLLKFLFSV